MGEVVSLGLEIVTQKKTDALNVVNAMAQDIVLPNSGSRFSFLFNTTPR